MPKLNCQFPIPFFLYRNAGRILPPAFRTLAFRTLAKQAYERIFPAEMNNRGAVILRVLTVSKHRVLLR